MTTLVDGGAIPVGTILAFGGPISAIPDGFLACNGALVNRNDYADLFAVIGTQWGTDSGVDFRVPTCNGNLIRGRANGSGADPERASRTAVQAGGVTGDNVGSLQTWRVQSHRHIVGPIAAGIAMNTTGDMQDWQRLAYVNGEVASGAGNNAGPVTNKAAIGGALYSAQLNSDGFTFFNGNFNNNDTSPNTTAEVLTKKGRLYTTNTGNSQTVGRNVYVEFIIKY